MPSLAQIEHTGNTAVDVGVPILTSYQSTGRKSQSAPSQHFQNEVRNHKPQYDAETGSVRSNGNGYLTSNGNGNGHVPLAETEGDIDTTDFVNGNGIHLNGNGYAAHRVEDVVKAEKVTVKSAQIPVSPLKSVGLHTSAAVHAIPQGSPNDPSLAWTRDGKVYDKGPDQILPSEAIYTWYPNGATRINKLEGPIGNLEPISVPTLLRRCVDRSPDKNALTIKRNGKWVNWTFRQYYDDVRTAAKGFIALGLERYHTVCILGFNSPEWFISDFAAIFAGGMGAGIYTTNNPEACAYCALDSKANIYVVEDDKQLEKILEIRHQLPDLKAVVQYTGEPKAEGVLSWAQLMHLGNQQSDDELEKRLKSLAINQCCTLIYTSGTTGNPKGVMLTHDNLTWMARVNKNWAEFREGDFQETVISFLPLSHVAAQMADIYSPLSACGVVAFADKNALKGTLVEDMKEVRPTKFLAVPRVWEKMYEKITEIGRSTTGLKKVVATWAKAKGLEYNMKRMNGVPNPETLGFKIANKVVLSKVKDALGLGRCDLNLSGAAPLSPDILKFFMSLNVVVTEAYGMSECSGPHTMATGSQFRLGSVGRTMTGCVTKIDKPNAEGHGEICMFGRHLTIGYLYQEEKTKGAIDEEGWLHSEDIGKVDEDGYLFITGRIKEILITAGGENVAPVPIEDNIKSELPLVSQAVVLGDKLKFLSVLLTFKTEVDMNSQEPLDKLTRVSKDWVEKNGNCTVETIQDVIKEVYEKKNKELIDAIQAGINGANKKAVSQAQKIQKWVILPVDFSIPGGELGPTLKLKRQTVYDKYKSTIAEIYNV